ncbi:MAG: dTDP-4-keto-6-deoxy-D-glucose epimerase, partial [Lentisphaerae bacterium]|nr:dTDP-4-keto-6-deoxy-D-glucose epimerase [Lentisphaerota bacterium]
MKVETTSLNGVLLITPPTIFNDFRGCYVETYNARLYQEAGIRINFIQDDISVSARHVLRGLHG